MPSPVGASFSMRTCRAPSTLTAGSAAAGPAARGRCGVSAPSWSFRAWADPSARPRPPAARRPRGRAPRARLPAGPRKAPLPASGRGGRASPRSARRFRRTPGSRASEARVDASGSVEVGPPRRAPPRARGRGPRGPPSCRRRPRAPGAPLPRDVSARRSQAPSTASRQYDSELTRPTGLALLAAGERLVDPGLDGLERHAERAPFAQQREVRRREQERGPAPSDERGLDRLVVDPILLGCAHR